MTVSERAKQIYKLIKPSGKTWADAIHQAREEIYYANMQKEEEEIKRELDRLEDKTNNDPGPLGVNLLLNDILIELEEKIIRQYEDETKEAAKKGEKIRRYTYTETKRRLERSFYTEEEIRKNKNIITEYIGFDEFTDLIYEYTKADSWDSDWRDPYTGHIRNEWLNTVVKIIVNLGLDIGKLENYNSVAGYFR